MIRKHDAPQAKKLRAVQQAAKGFGYDINTGSSKTLAESLKKYEGSPDSDALRLMLTYCMSLAMYVSSGIDHAGEYIGHYALAVPLYTHFTSPIRRYCDLVVHRQLLLSLEIEKMVNQMKEKGINDPKIDPSSEELQYSKFFLSDEETALIAEHANECKTNARNAGTYSIKSFFCFYLRALEQRARLDGSVAWPITDNAICSKVTKNSFVLVSRQTAIEVEIFHNSRNQLWVEPNEVDPVKGKFTINWGPQQEGGEPQIEAGGLFFNCVVEFRVVQGARIDVDFVVRPPWDRKSVTGVPTSLAAEDA
jgi:exoribonuclease R